MDQKMFADRFAKLRIDKGVSARDMSLSIGQSAGYINNIENGINYPSMSMFFYICDYFEITPQEFFDTDSSSPIKLTELNNIVKGFSDEQLDCLITLSKMIDKNNA